ncbi:hypothetical protein OEA41_004983 [Lepraria neglecta]|uniref:NAD(P)-binding protein n=1 Tax=Lepraria neglecta TaxID=209136 RepID=A0AAE0DGM1_9LECA|nr:hypothetical protein OEA41_004983 [Lepraria neglecta]
MSIPSIAEAIYNLQAATLPHILQYCSIGAKARLKDSRLRHQQPPSSEQPQHANAEGTDAATAVEVLQTKHNITSLDNVIAKAGISDWKAFGPMASVKIDDVKDHVDVNAIGSLLLFQATLPLLKKVTHGPGKFVTVSSPIESIGAMEQRRYPMAVYWASKAMVNSLTRKIHFERE